MTSHILTVVMFMVKSSVVDKPVDKTSIFSTVSSTRGVQQEVHQNVAFWVNFLLITPSSARGSSKQGFLGELSANNTSSAFIKNCLTAIFNYLYNLI